MNKPSIYEGKEKYIFVSYRHMDAERVYPILHELEKRGLRFWYDAGIHTGDEWDEVIDDHIVNSHAVLVFLSKEYCQSKNCREELKYARNIEKRLLFVYLEPTELPQGIRMRTSGMQAIHYHEFEQKEAFYEKLYLCKELKTCSESIAEEEPVLEAQNKGGRSKWIKPLLGLALASAVAAGIGLFGGNKLPEEVEQVAEAEQAEAEEAEKFVRIILNANENSSVKEYHEDLEILKERLNILTAGEPYELTVEGHAAYLQIPEQALQGLDAAEILRCYLTRPIELYGCSQETVDSLNPKKILIKRSEILRVEQMYGSIEGIRPEDYGFAKEEYPYIKVVLSESCVERYQNELEISSDSLVLVQDMDLSPYYYYTTISTDDPGTFYILKHKMTEPLAKLIVYNLTHEPLDEGFTFRADAGYMAEWENVSNETLPGENQCDVRELSGDYAILTYSLSSMDQTQGALIQLEVALKERLDALDQPYAFGWLEQEGKRSVMIKTGTAHMGDPIIEALNSSHGISLRSGMMERTLYHENIANISYEKQSNGSYRMVLNVASGDAERVVSGIDEQNEILLLIENQPYLSGKVLHEEANTIVFDQICFLQKGAIVEENLWIPEFVSAILLGTKMPGYIVYDQDRSSLFTDTFANHDALEVGVSYDALVQEIQAKIVNMVDETSQVRLDGDTIKVQCDLPVDETLPAAALELAKQVYEITEFEQGAFGSLIIYPIKENAEVRERFRIIFGKTFHSTPENGFLYAHGIFTNGRLERYEDRMKNELASSEFYKKLSDAYIYSTEPWSYE